MPNFFGEQRFGHRENTHVLGEMLVRRNAAEFVAAYLGRPQAREAPHIHAARQLIDEGRWPEALAQWPNNLPDERRVLSAIVKTGGQPEVAFAALETKLKSFFVSAFQSQLFNELLMNRLAALDQLENGDVAYIHGRGAAFIVRDASVERPALTVLRSALPGHCLAPKHSWPKGSQGSENEPFWPPRT